MRIAAIVFAALVAVLGGGYFWLSQNGYQVTMTRAELQKKLEEKLPIKGKRGPLEYTVGRAALDLRPDGRVAVDADVAVSALGQKANATIQGSGVLEYRAGEFFLRQVAVEKVTVAKPAEDEKGGLGAMVLKQMEGQLLQLGGPILDAVLEKNPVFRLKPDNLKHNVAKLAITKVEVRDQALLVTLNPFKAE
jgi:Protein of unknown function (DUF1439)